ncbi:glycoside hydrolase [Catenaria anguillulae PL171]|uniref:Glycoside hydrolase n=1 Tax=Catenaria anguillulae PL171 TaxID=765915 RepID=A0A1Y2HSU4_9FUNG|nr:glycoside hydrolase [Catenaria anguillulae PL171]
MVHQPINLGYYCSWTVYGPRNYSPLDIPVEKLTHVAYAFANIQNGVIVPGDLWADAQKPYTAPNGTTLLGAYAVLNHPDSPLRQRNRNFKSLISIGGWTFSKEFSLVARTPEARQKFADSVVQFIEQYGFQGCDLDWEFPGEGGLPENHRHPDDGKNFTLLAQALRQSLDQLGARRNNQHYILSACTAHAEWLYKNLDLPGLGHACDHLLLMTYDAAGAWSKTTAHHAPFSCIESAVRGYTARGVPAAKLLAGLPLAGRSFGGVCSGNVGAPINKEAPAPGTHAKGIVDYDDLAANYTQAHGYSWQLDPQAMTPVVFNPNTQVWVTAESEESIMKKAKASVEQLGLSGVFLWELSQDRRAVLTGAAAKALNIAH